MMILLLTAILFSPGLAEEKKALTSLEELPHCSFPLRVSIEEFVNSQTEQRALASALREKLLTDIEDLVIDDSAVEREVHSRLLQLDLASGRLDDALNDIKAMRRFSDTEARKLMSSLHAEAWALSRKTAGIEADPDQLLKTYIRHLRECLASKPRDAILGEVAKRRMKMQFMSKGMLDMAISRIGSDIKADGLIDDSSAHTLIGMCNALNFLPLKDATTKIYGDFLLEKETKARAPVMTDRQVALQETDHARPVVIAVWDTGVDVGVFPGLLFVNPRERLDGKDSDGNGYVDDVNGIAFGLDLKPTQGLLMPHELDEETHAHIKQCLKGAEDTRTGFDTPEAAAINKLSTTLSRSEWREIGRQVAFYDIHCHGTHVAGIACAGNPFARILPVRVGFDDEERKTEEWARAFSEMCRRSVEYFKANGVRVANLSWGWDVHEIEDNLIAHGAGNDAAKEEAAGIFDILEKGLRTAIAGAPDILFVNGAGDAQGDPAGYRWIPGIFDLPNVIPVGAVNEFGELTPFSDHGSHVRLLADGFHVESYIPGGDRMALSGTSMAAPQATNLAAKLMALEPSLKPEQVIALMIDGGEEVERGGRTHILLNPAASVKLLRERE